MDAHLASPGNSYYSKIYLLSDAIRLFADIDQFTEVQMDGRTGIREDGSGVEHPYDLLEFEGSTLQGFAEIGNIPPRLYTRQERIQDPNCINIQFPIEPGYQFEDGDYPRQGQ